MPDRLRFDTDHGVYGHPGDVTPWDIRFDPNNRAHLESTGPQVTFRVWAEPELTGALLVVRWDQEVTAFPMERVSKGRRFNFWEVTAPPRPFEYSFAFRTSTGRPVYRVPAGVSNAVERLDRWTLDPHQPLFETPKWAAGALIYQIFPDRFSNGNPEINPSDVRPWDASPTSRGFWGGDLVGITNRLDYLADLGVDLLYLNPVFTSPSNHRYDTVDYYQVDPRLGTNDDLWSLTAAAHRLGMRVMLDASFNHVHPRFFAFQDLIANGPESEYADWFVVNDWPPRIRHRPQAASDWAHEWLPVWQEETGLGVDVAHDDGPAVEPTYDAWYGVANMPRVNLANKAARIYMLDVAKHWLTQFDIDGWRMDVTRYVDPDFWNDFRTVTKTAKSDVLLLSEVMGDASQWLQGDRFDATMNYTFRDIALGFFARSDTSGSEALDRIGTMIAQYAHAATVCGQNLLGSHDTPRFMTETNEEQWRVQLAMVCQMTLPGAPSIYYGDEVGLTGDDDPGCRSTFPWESDPTSHSLYQTIQSLAQLRRRDAALTRGSWHPAESGPDLISYERRHRDDQLLRDEGVFRENRLLIVINRSAHEASIRNDDQWSTTVWGDADISETTITIEGHSACIVGQ